MGEKRIIHLLPGDALVETFTSAKIAGEIFVCRECLADGPKSASGEEFWHERARFIAESGEASEPDYHRLTTAEFQRLFDAASSGAEINLWFEYELFCQANFWFTLDYLSGTSAKLFRVAPRHVDTARIWRGFSNHDATELNESFTRRVAIEAADIELGRRLWAAYSRKDYAALNDLKGSASAAFPMLDDVLAAAIEEEDTPRRLVTEIVDSGVSEFGEVFTMFRDRLGIYGYGDTQVRRIWREISGHN